jgi:hypothetical protein
MPLTTYNVYVPSCPKQALTSQPGGGRAHVGHLEQGCQIFLGPKYQNGEKYTKLPQNVTNGQKHFQWP